MTSEKEETKKFTNVDNIDNIDNIDHSSLGKKLACIIKVINNIKDGCYIQECDFNDSEHNEEKERLFPPFSFFKIKKVKFDNEELSKNKKYDGTQLHPFKIVLEIINRNFYLDQAILKKKEFDYIKKINIWKLKEN